MHGVEQAVPGALYIQAYDAHGGQVAGTYAAGYGMAGGLPAVIDHTFGKGRTRLLGTFPGAARHRAGAPVERHGLPTGSTFTTHRVTHVFGTPSDARLAAARAFFGGLLDWAGITQHVRTDNPAIIARLHADTESGSVVLWALNPTSVPQRATLTLANSWGPFADAHVYWGERPASVKGSVVTVEIGPRDGVIARLIP